MEYIVKISKIEPVTHDVKKFTFEKPKGYKFIPGQATLVSVNKPEWKKEKRPFTFTCLNEEDYLEFTIKIYPQHKGVTNELGKLKVGDELIIRECWGTINYKGPGVFIAGGAGITPFIAIFKQLQKEGKLKGNKLIFSNKTSKDVILEKLFKKMFGKDLILVLTREEKKGHEQGHIDEDLLKKYVNDFNQFFYVCGPPPLVEGVKGALDKLGAKTESIVFEKPKK